MYREQDPEIKMRYMYEKFADFFAADYKKLKVRIFRLVSRKLSYSFTFVL